ncbi:MAG: hypothetical protein H6557_05535 [Lewinellaceae bacterium]|nr:hypothetical protein [Lewinellaceae bacterium]
MTTKRLIIELEQMPDNQDFKLFLELARKLKATIIQKQGSSDESWEPLSLQIAKRPEDINALAIREADIEPLIDLFSDEASAEELCKLL